jgi:hypothetical protein
MELCSCNHCCCGNALSITYSECVFLALITQHAMSHIVICGLPALQYFFPHIINGIIFKKKKLFNMKCVFRFSLQHLSETFLILRTTKRDMIKNVYFSSCKVPVTLAIFERILNFLNTFSESPQISNFMKIRLVGAELFHADERAGGQTGQTYRS